MSSATVAPSGRPPVCTIPPIFPAAAASVGAMPSTRTWPEVCLRRPSMVSIAVDLPAPFGPSSATVSPRTISKLT
jgi:hypothetical protein